MDVPLLLAALGGLLVVLGLAGGGIKTKWVEVPSPIGKWIRVASVIFGILCVSGGTLLYIYEKAVPRGAPRGGPEGTEKPGGPAAAGMPGGEGGSLEERGLEVSGKVIDVFGNPREGVVVLLRGRQRYGLSDGKGRYLLSGVPREGDLALDALYGGEKDSLSLSVELVESGLPAGKIAVQEPLVLNPVTLDAVLCRYVEHGAEGLQPVGVFGGEVPNIPLDSLFTSGGGDSPTASSPREIWCFLKVTGPDRYEMGRTTNIFFEWEWEGEPQGRPYVQAVGVRAHGWRTRVAKRVWAGAWSLRISAAHAELARVSFEVY
jgi:hypothetical protein